MHIKCTVRWHQGYYVVIEHFYLVLEFSPLSQEGKPYIHQSLYILTFIQPLATTVLPCQSVQSYEYNCVCVFPFLSSSRYLV